MDRVEEAVLKALRAVVPACDPASLAPDRPFRDQMEFDSIDFLNFVMKLETMLDIRVAEPDYPRLITLDGCRAHLAALAAQSPA